MNITLTREEAQQVLDVIERNIVGVPRREASDLLRARLSAPEPEYRDVVIKGDLWRIEFLPDHAASVVLVRANYEAQPEPEPVTDKYLMEVECTKCGAKQDGVLTVTVPPQPEPPCKTGSQCIGGKCPQCVVSEPEPVAWMQSDMEHFSLWKDEWHTIPLYPAPPQREEGCAECGKKSSDGWALYCVKCSEREWQGLTDAEMMDLELSAHDLNSVSIIALRRFGRAVESKLKEKNS